MKSKLILVDGLTGAGKSTISHFIARQYQLNQHDIRWYQEEEKDHPLVLKNLFDRSISPEARKEEFINTYHQYWKDLCNKISDAPQITIIESYLFQYPLAFLMSAELEESEIAKIWTHLLDQVKELNPIFIYLYHKNVEDALRLNWKRRGEEWANWHISRMKDSRYAKSRNMDAETAIIDYYSNIQRVSLDLFYKYPAEKLIVDTTAQDWDNHRREIIDFLKLPYQEEILLRDQDHEIAGHYQIKLEDGNEMTYKVYIHDQRINIDAFWPQLKLIPAQNNDYLLEGYPFRFTFNRNDQGAIAEMKISNDFFDQEEDWVLQKID